MTGQFHQTEHHQTYHHKNIEANATVNKTATTVLSTDLTKLEAAELKGM